MAKVGLHCINDENRRKMINETVESLSRGFGENLLSVVVFGSVARGEAVASSDTDMLVVSEDFPKSLSERMDRLVEVLTSLEKTEVFKQMRATGINTWIQFHPLTPYEAKLHRPIYLDMVEDGIIVYDKNYFMKNVLAGLEKRLKELGARKVTLEGGGWYWDLKPDIRRGEVVEV